MVGILLCGHGDLPVGLKGAAEMIFGAQEGLEAASLRPDTNLDEYRAALEDACERLDRGDGVLVLADLFGGSPANTSAYLLSRPRVAVVTGASLPALLEVLSARAHAGLEELVRIALKAGREGLRDLRAALQAEGG
ncbi:MAG: PTS sugar transporter subunit IIA [Clostridia bacterium]|nr:PTS sugar transporter subunit IIA [Clostridia bacterium]